MNNDELIFANLIKNRAQTHAELDVLTFVNIDQHGQLQEQGRTYAQLWENGQKLANGFAEAEMAQGDSFALMMENHAEFVDAMVASSVKGTIFVPIDPRVKGEKLAYMIGFADCRGVICADYALQNLLPVLDQLPLLNWVWVLSTGELEQLPSDTNVSIKWLSDVAITPATPIEVQVSDSAQPMQLLYTSGTTGDPKAIMSPYQRLAVAQMAPDLFGLTDNDRPYTGLSLTHANAQLLTLCASLYKGMRAVISRKFTKSRLWDITRHYGCTVFNLLGGMATAVYAEEQRSSDADNPVRMVISAGMPKEIWSAFSKRFDLEIFEFYGAAEGGLTVNPAKVGPIGSIGKPPASLTCSIVDQQGKECEPGQEGEIIFQNADGSAPVVKYFKNAGASAAKVIDGWLRMGDVGYRDEQGWFYFLYRQGSGIRKNGVFISQGMIEKELSEHESINDVFVYGISTESNAPGEKEPVVAVVPVKNAQLDANELFALCQQRLEGSQQPTFIQVVDEIPKTASEKPIERFLLESFNANQANVYCAQRPQ